MHPLLGGGLWQMCKILWVVATPDKWNQIFCRMYFWMMKLYFISMVQWTEFFQEWSYTTPDWAEDIYQQRSDRYGVVCHTQHLRFQDYTFFQDVTINTSGSALCGIGTISRHPTSSLSAAHMVPTRHNSAKFCHWYLAVELPTRKMDWP